MIVYYKYHRKARGVLFEVPLDLAEAKRITTIVFQSKTFTRSKRMLEICMTIYGTMYTLSS